MVPCKLLFVLVLLISYFGVNSQANFTTTSPFSAQKYASVPSPRGIFVDPSNDILVLSRSTGQIIVLHDTSNGDGTITVSQTVLVNSPLLNLNHGIAFHRGFLYASSDTTVYRWPYVPGSRIPITASPQVVISNIPTGGHPVRTLVFDWLGRLYVSIGAASNIDTDPTRGKIVRFNLFSIPSGGINFSSGVVVARGLRVEVGLDFDILGALWGVELGASGLVRPDLGGDIHNGNPAEELNKFDRPLGTFYGSPYCFSSYNIPSFPGVEPGTQFAWPTFMSDGVHTDLWCRNELNNQPPVLAMPAHESPLGIQFYNGRGCLTKVGAFPCSGTGDAFVAFHGSFDSDTRVGYRVGRLPFKKIWQGYEPTGEIQTIIIDADVNNCGSQCFRPVSVVFDLEGHLIVSGDETGEIFRVYYNASPPPIA